MEIWDESKILLGADTKPIKSPSLQSKAFRLWLASITFLLAFILVFLSVIWLTHLNTNAEILCLLFAFGIIFTLWKLKRKTDTSKLAEIEIIKQKEQLEELYRRLNDVRENECARISRKIHDELGQSLTALKMDLNWTNSISANNLPSKNKIAGMIEIVNDIIKKVQHIASDLRPAILDDLGLISAIEWYCEEFEKRSGLLCNLELEEIPSINLKTELTLFRILQEGLTNIVRHSQAKNVTVQVSSSLDKIYLKISDDGIGISNEKIRSIKSLGLIGIKERLKEFNGTLEIISSENKGTSLVIFIPLLSMESK